jgi:hypothetical protein
MTVLESVLTVNVALYNKIDEWFDDKRGFQGGIAIINDVLKS